MSTSTRFVPFALGAALLVAAAGTAAAEPPASDESPRPHAVPRAHLSQAPSAPAAPAVAFRSEPRQEQFQSPIAQRPGVTQVRFSETGDPGDDQARARGGSRGGGSSAGSSSGGRSGGRSGTSMGTARPRGGDGGYSAPRSGSDDSSSRRGDSGSRRGGDNSSAYDGGDRRGNGGYYGGSDRNSSSYIRGRNGATGVYAVPRNSRPYSYYPRYDYNRSYRPSYYYPYYGNWGLGFYFWDPSWYGWGYGGYGGYGYGGYGGYYGGPYSYGYGSRYDDTGSVRFRVTPRDAQVFVDGYYVGVVDEFDGTFQRLRLEEGPHRIEVRLDGFDTLRFDVRVLIDNTITLRGDLRPVP